MKTTTIFDDIFVEAPPEAIFETFIDGCKHGDLIGQSVIIEPRIEGNFTAFNGKVKGTIRQLIKNKKIVFSWTIKEDEWPKNHYSLATINLEEKRNGTHLQLIHDNIPRNYEDRLRTGWQQNYWKPMKEKLGNNLKYVF
ncbi:MAG: SRPBCC domain-containing protein [Vulcanimicrobiota bacterium]